MKRSICALALCLALLAGLLTPTALAAGEKPSFPQQPQSITVTAPDTAVFTAQATGDPTYQWQAKDESGWLDILGATRSTYTIRSTATAMNGRQYRCQATNASGTTYSNTVTLTVNEGPAYVPPALKPVTALTIHFPAPKVGDPVYYVFSEANDQYGALFSWNQYIGKEGFGPGMDYVLCLELHAKQGYTLDGLTAGSFTVPGAKSLRMDTENGHHDLYITWPTTPGDRLYSISATTTNPSWIEDHGTLSLSTHEATEGTTVILTTIPDKNYVVRSAVYQVYDPDTGEKTEYPCTPLGNGKYSFVVGKGGITAYVTFYNPSLPTLPYEDVYHDWQKTPIQFVMEKGYMNGMQEGYFCPEWAMTRAMTATILYRMAGQPAVDNAQTTFADVDAASWYGPAVAWAKERGIIDGYSPTQFGPNDHISREQMAALFWRYTGSPVPTKALTVTDRDAISDYAKDAMAWAMEKQLFDAPNAPTALRPKAEAQRVDMANLLWHYYGAPPYKAS